MYRSTNITLRIIFHGTQFGHIPIEIAENFRQHDHGRREHHAHGMRITAEKYD